MIKLFEQFNNEQEIHDICKKYYIENYTINSDGTIDVNETVDLSGLLRDIIPIKFNVVRGDFYCYNNKLTSLINSPRIVDGIFSCSKNKLTSLEGSPERVGDYFYCSHNQITQLDNLSLILTELNCSANKITELSNLPNSLFFLDYSHNQITELNNIPSMIYLTYINCRNDKITNPDILKKMFPNTKIKY